MSRANELVKAIEEYMLENGVNPEVSYTAKYWNECLGTNYAPATYTSAVNSGLMEKWKYGNDAYVYRLVLRGELKKKYEEMKHEEDIEYAKLIVSIYEERLDEYKQRYESEIEQAKKIYNQQVEDLNTIYQKALKTLNN